MTARKEYEQARTAYMLAQIRFNQADSDLTRAAALEVEAAKERLNAAIRRAKIEYMARKQMV